MKIYNETKKIEICQKAHIANTFFSRFLGLMFKVNLPQGEGLLLFPGAMIHTCFMRFSIDIVFISKDMEVVSVYTDLKPWRFSSWQKNAYYVLETSSGSISGKVYPGDKILFVET